MFKRIVLCLLAVAAAFAQQTAIIQGRVTDESGAVIPGANVTISGERGFAKTVSTNETGLYMAAGLTPGKYTVRAVLPGFTPGEATVDVSGTKTVDLALNVALEKQEVTVKEDAAPQVSVAPEENAGALVLRGTDLDALPDDPDDLESDLQALAGPSAGPNGGQLFIDGFSGGRLPPKASIREIRINQNPFAAEYDRLGFGRIEILTKPGTDRFRGQAFFGFSDDTLNSRNPYAPNKAPFQQRQYGGNLSGPLSKKSSFFFDFDRREIDDNAVINATILDPTTFAPTQYGQAIVTPHRRTSLSPRVDYQLTTNNTLVARYTYTESNLDNAGIGQFSLLSRAYNTGTKQHTFQLTETSVLGAKVVNETRFQFMRNSNDLLGNNTIPTINVLEAFTGGGSQVGHSYNDENHWELQNFTSIAQGSHGIKFGVRVRGLSLNDYSPNNFGGSFTFAGGFAPLLDSNLNPILDASGNPETGSITSIERYRRTLLLQQQGLSAAQIRALGGGASQFTMAAGNPLASLNQFDFGPFFQDDWRVRPNFTLSLGLRYETQTNMHDWTDFGPRLGFAWAPGSRGGKQGKTVIRGGFGMFYDRFSENLVLQTLRYNGVNQQQYVVINPDFYPNIPAASTLANSVQQQTIHEAASNLRAPYTLQTAIGVERQLPKNTTFALTYTDTRAIHLLRSRNIAAPVNGETPAGTNALYLYESSGVLHQHQMIANVNSRINRKISLFAFYVLNKAESNTDGAGTFPADQYNLSTEWGRSSLDIRHRFMLGGSILAPGNVRFSPFVIAHSGQPFNITVGRDLNGDTLFTDRPAFATDLTGPGVVDTPWGAFNPNPIAGQTIIPRNFGEGPGYFSVNLRLSRTWGFGSSASPRPDGMPGGGGGPRGGGGRGGPGGMRMGGGGGMRGIFGGDTTEKRYNVTLSISARNLFNTTNAGLPIGNLSSTLFGVSNTLAGGFGPSSSAGNRRVEMQLRFSF